MLGPPTDAPSFELSFGFDALPQKKKKSQGESTSQHHQLAWNLGKTWPLLERFELESSQGPRGIRLSYDARSLTLLPPSLTWLGLPCRNLHGSLEALPPNLQTLHIFTIFCDLSPLPHSITDLKIYLTDSALCELLHNPQILPNLKSFPTADHSFGLPGFRSRIRSGTPLPANMTTLEMFARPSSCDKLPAALTSFTLENNGWAQVTICYNDIMVLPRGLTYLRIKDIDWKDVDTSMWPSTLTTLIILELPFSFNWFELLPRRLTSFSVINRDVFQDVILNPNYAALCTTGQASLQLDLALWTSMKYEMLQMGTSANIEAVNAYIKSVESGRFYGLPLTLTHLNIPRMTLNDDSLLVLPPNLATLEIHELPGLNNPPLFGAFSPTSAATHVTVHANHVLLSPGDVIPSMSSLYNFASLTWLTLAEHAAFSVSELFKYLPRTLLKLEFLDGEILDPWTTHSEALKDLPQNLEYLTFWGDFSDDNVGQWSHFLPKTLKTLIMPQQSINGLSFKDLPPKLETLHCTFYDVELSQILDLPRTLASLSVYRGMKSDSLPDWSIDEAWQSLLSAFRPFWRVWEAGLVGLQVEFTIASKIWSKSNLGKDADDYTEFIDRLLSDDSSCSLLISDGLNVNAVDQARVNYEYASADITKYLLASEEDTLLIDPRTARRISRYL